MNISSDSIIGRNVVFDYILEDIPGGLSLDKTRVPATQEYFEAGTPLYVNRTTRVAEVVKTAVCVADSASGDAVRVAKGHLFAAGDYITDGYVVTTIATLTTTNAAYDIFVPTATLVNYATGVVIVESAVGKVAGTQAAVTVITVVSTGKYITVADPSGKAAGLVVSVANNGGANALAVSFSGKTLSILLAQTAASNTPEVEIQAAVRALSNNAYDFTQFVVTGDEISGTVAGFAAVTGTMAVNSPYAYTPNALLKDRVNVEGANAECSAVIRGSARESALPYPLGSVLKGLMPLFTFNI